MSDREHADRLRRYLLGELPGAEPEAIEATFFASEDASAELLAVEAELLDQCVRGELPDAARERLERRAQASSRGRRELAFARVLARGLRRREPGRWGVWLTSAAALAAALVGAVSVGHRDSGHDQPRSLVLSPPVRDATTPPSVALTPDDELLRLYLLVEGPHDEGTPPVVTLVGPRMHSQRAGARWTQIEGRSALLLELPARILEPGEHTLSVPGLGDYGFRVAASPD